MKIQLKRSNVIAGSTAKEPTPEQMEYGELAINFSSVDPAIFLKNSNNSVVRIAGLGAVGAATTGNGQINVNAGNGINASGTNATANQSQNTTRSLSIDTSWLANYVNTSADVNCLKLSADAGGQTVASTGTTTFSGTISAAKYDLESLDTLP